MGFAEFDEAGAFGVAGDVTLEADFTHFGGSTV
jgi:hypothetical protein